jgi:peptide-methionine (R)-S-oxide reductase
MNLTGIPEDTPSEEATMEEKIRKDEKEWKKELTQNQYYVTRQKGTEPPFTGEYADTEHPGMYKCVCCGQPLFESDTKFHSGSGWPSFHSPVNQKAVETETDKTHGMSRTEVKCSKCTFSTMAQIPPACVTASIPPR